MPALLRNCAVLVAVYSRMAIGLISARIDFGSLVIEDLAAHICAGRMIDSF
jgi:hypothetical protein